MQQELSETCGALAILSKARKLIHKEQLMRTFFETEESAFFMKACSVLARFVAATSGLVADRAMVFMRIITFVTTYSRFRSSFPELLYIVVVLRYVRIVYRRLCMLRRGDWRLCTGRFCRAFSHARFAASAAELESAVFHVENKQD